MQLPAGQLDIPRAWASEVSTSSRRRKCWTAVVSLPDFPFRLQCATAEFVLHTFSVALKYSRVGQLKAIYRKATSFVF